MRKILVVLAVALLVPAAAIAGKPAHPGKSSTAGSNAAPKVMYVLKGSLTAYTAAGASDGSVTIMVKSSNYHGRALKGQTLQIPVSASTKVGSLANWHANDNGIVKVRAAKGAASPAALIAALQLAKASQVIDQGAPKS